MDTLSSINSLFSGQFLSIRLDFDVRFSLYESTGSSVHVISRMYEPECTNQIAVVAVKIGRTRCSVRDAMLGANRVSGRNRGPMTDTIQSCALVTPY